MPEFWENCNNKSKAVLIQLYWQEQGCYPDFYHIMKGDKEKPAPKYEIPVNPPEDTEKFMSDNSDVKARMK
jgi:hypothetical protein